MTEPTDAELDELRQANSGRLNFVTFSEFRTIARAVLAKWGTLRAEKIVIPTDTMEQEFQKHYRLGYEAGKKAATPQPTQAQAGAVPLTDEQIEALPLWKRFVGLWPETRREIVRTIEHHHGIGLKGGQHG